VPFRLSSRRKTRTLDCTVFATGASACAPKSNSNLGVASPAIQTILAKAHDRIAPEPDIAPGLPQGEPSIAGMWTSTVVADGQALDIGFEQWTNGGLQVLNDMSPILAGNICYGTWVKIAPYTYKLNHPAFLYDDAWVNVICIGYIRATVTLDKSGKTYSGVSTFEGYDLAGDVLVPISSAELVGQRLGVDTTVRPLALGTSPNGNGSSVLASRRTPVEELAELPNDGRRAMGAGRVLAPGAGIPSGSVLDGLERRGRKSNEDNVGQPFQANVTYFAHRVNGREAV
jgi:hypothetical protein